MSACSMSVDVEHRDERVLRDRSIDRADGMPRVQRGAETCSKSSSIDLCCHSDEAYAPPAATPLDHAPATNCCRRLCSPIGPANGNRF